jgi:hypothetical protein
VGYQQKSHRGMKIGFAVEEKNVMFSGAVLVRGGYFTSSDKWQDSDCNPVTNRQGYWQLHGRIDDQCAICRWLPISPAILPEGNNYTLKLLPDHLNICKMILLITYCRKG